MPNKEVRKDIFLKHLDNDLIPSEKEIDQLCQLTDGYSCSDLVTVMNETYLRPVKEL